MNMFQSIEMDGSIALDMTVFNQANSTEGGTLLLAVAVPGLETNSTLWKYADGQFQLMQQLNTIGPMDVLFTTTDASTYLTFAQVSLDISFILISLIVEFSRIRPVAINSENLGPSTVFQHESSDSPKRPVVLKCSRNWTLIGSLASQT
jgi:hypothetical protein